MVTNTQYRGTGRGRHRWANLFEVTNRRELEVAYRLLEVQNLPPGDHYEKNINQLLKAVRYELRQPVALVRDGSAHFLAIPADATLPQLQRQLMPHVVTLAPRKESHILDFARLDADTAQIAIAFLHFALSSPLQRSQDLWGSGRAYYYKQALNRDNSRDRVDIYPGFTWNVIVMENGRLFLAVDTTSRYVDRYWLPERWDENDPNRYLRRHCLYHFGHQWYPVQLWGLTGRTIAEQQFFAEGETQAHNVFAYTKEQWRMNPPAWVRDLGPDSPAIIYHYPGNEKERYGALALCKLLLSTADEETAYLHRLSILEPAARFGRIAEIVARHFQHAGLGSHRIQITEQPLEIERRFFPVPAQRFGKDRVLAVERGVTAQATDVVPLPQLGQRRLQLVLDPQAGPLDTTPFDVQYLFLPQSLHRSINDDFMKRFQSAMQAIAHKPGYAVQRVLYDDGKANSLYAQVQAIKSAISSSRIDHGYALLVLPERAKRDLHNYMKRELWPDLQFQCAMANKIRSYYEWDARMSIYSPGRDRAHKLASYVQNCAFGMMVVNRKWIWSLAAPLHYEVYIGIDVLNGMAGFTFVYNHGRHIYFRNCPCKQKERLTMPLMRETLLKHLSEDLADLQLRPRSIVIHRDGRTFPSELQGLHRAVQELKSKGVLPREVLVGAVDIRKTTADRLRLVEGESLQRAQNCPVGSYYILGRTEGVVCTTGWPFRFPGTAKPLAAFIAEGDLNVAWVLEDIFALSQLAFTAPDKCARLPLTVKLADDFLEPIASQVEDEGVLYETELAEALDSLEEDAFMSDTLGVAVSRPMNNT
ncbi:MAG TPA: hypothetical protein VFA09_07010 [Ktedonobacteraceae bacterium]|nr:hypothetical protein [Ktedonobacteraceae bacterium]